MKTNKLFRHVGIGLLASVCIAALSNVLSLIFGVYYSFEFGEVLFLQAYPASPTLERLWNPG